MKRRRFLALGVGAAAATGAASVPGIGTASAASEDVQLDSRPDKVVDRAFEYVTLAMDAYQQGSTLRIIQSYADSQLQGDGLTFSEVLPATAYIYDSSLAIIAFLGRRQPGRRGHDDLRRAMVLGDSLLYAQDHDPVYSDGRLRSAYWVAPFVVPGARNDFYFVRPDGTVNLVGAPWFILGGSTGEMACAGIALAHLFTRTRARRYLDGAVRLGQWIVDSAFDSTGLGGYTYGVDADNHRIAPTKSLEHNAGVYALFTNFLAPLTGDGRWDDLGQHARLFIDAMWNSERGFFYIGSSDGKTVNDTILAVDVQAWSYLALLDRRYAAGLDWGKTNMATTDTPLSLHSSLKGNLCLSGVGSTDAGRRATEPANPSSRYRIPTLSGSPGRRSWQPHCAPADRRLPISRPFTATWRRRASIWPTSRSRRPRSPGDRGSETSSSPTEWEWYKPPARSTPDSATRTVRCCTSPRHHGR